MSSTRSVKSPGPWAADATTTIPGSPLSGVPYRRTSVVTADAREGWPFDTLVDSAEFNELLYRYTTLVDIMDRQGVLGWSDQVDYAVPAIAFGSDGVLYKALLASGPTTTARDPISNPTYWQAVQAEAPAGSFKNLKLSATGTSANVTVTADQIVVDGATGSRRLSTVSLTVAGTSVGANALDAGTIATNTWYSVWVIWNGTTTAGLLSLSETAPTMPATYTHKARVGWIRTDGTGNKYPLAFKQNGRVVAYDPSSGANLTAYPSIASGSNSLVSTSASLTGTVPTTAGVCRAVVGSTSGQIGNIFASVRSSTTQGTSLAYHGSTVASVSSSSEFSATLVNRELFYASSNSAGYLQVSGWEDNL